jgi:hypothetical protein
MTVELKANRREHGRQGFDGPKGRHIEGRLRYEQVTAYEMKGTRSLDGYPRLVGKR